MANMGSQGILKHIDDPSVAIIADATAAGVTWVTDATTSATNFALAVAAGKGLHYIGVMPTTDDDMLEFCSNNEIFCPQEGHCAVETLIQFEDASEHSFTFGFEDDVECAALCVDLSGTTLTKDSTEFCGFVYDGTDATNKDLHCTWVDDDVIGQADANGSVDGQAIRMSGMHPTDAKWLYLKVEMQDRGSGKGVRATFLAVDHLGRSMEKTFNTTVDRDATFAYSLVVENRTDIGGDVFLRCCNWEQTIPNM